jgi:hypothetical protein
MTSGKDVCPVRARPRGVEARELAQVSIQANADKRAANVLPVIKAIKKAGAAMLVRLRKL